MTMNENKSKILGRTAALVVSTSTFIFGISLVWEMINLSDFAKYLGYIACIIIAIGVVIMMACYYDTLQKPLRIFGLLALISAILYAPLCIGTYYLQLSIVAFNPLESSRDVIQAINFKPGSPTFAVDMLGYTFLCLSTLAAGFGIIETKDKVLRILCLFHGALAIPTIASPIISGLFLSSSGETDFTGHFVLLFWCAVFTPIALLFMKYFRKTYPEK